MFKFVMFVLCVGISSMFIGLIAGFVVTTLAFITLGKEEIL